MRINKTNSPVLQGLQVNSEVSLSKIRKGRLIFNFYVNYFDACMLFYDW